MKKIFGVAIFVISLMFTLSQNLVINPSFENMVGTLQCDCYTMLAELVNAIIGWTCITGGLTHVFSVNLSKTCYLLSTNISAVDDLSMCVYDVTPQLNKDIIKNHFAI